jgi:hypothetical protein
MQKRTTTAPPYWSRNQELRVCGDGGGGGGGAREKDEPSSQLIKGDLAQANRACLLHHHMHSN